MNFSFKNASPFARKEFYKIVEVTFIPLKPSSESFKSFFIENFIRHKCHGKIKYVQRLRMFRIHKTDRSMPITLVLINARFEKRVSF